MATRPWRPLALASVVTATLAAAVVFRSVFTGEVEAPPAVPATETASPSAAPQTPPPVSVNPTLEAISSAVLVKRVFAPGEQVTATRGVGFLSAETGALETWSAVESGGPGFADISVTPDGVLLVYYPPGEGAAPYIVERATGKSWRLGAGAWPLVEAAHGVLLVVQIRDGDQLQPYVLNLVTGGFAPFGRVQHYLAGFSGLASPDGRRVAMQLGNEVALLDLATASLARLTGEASPDSFGLQLLSGALGFAIAPHDASRERRWFSWEGREIDGHLAEGAVSPNGKYVAREWSPGGIRAVGVGGSPTISAVTLVAREGGRPVAQFLGASTPQHGAQSWSANGESLIVEVPDGYRLVSTSGQTLASIPDDIHVLDPRPSPSIPGLLGTNRGTIINTVRGQTLAPKYEQEPWRARWGTKPGELIVELASPGKGRSWPIDVMPFEARTAGISDQPGVRLTGDGCTSVREFPASSSAIVECAERGLTGTLTAVDDPLQDPKVSQSGATARQVVGVEDDELTIWLHVDLSDGASGWVPATELAWS